MADVVVVSSRAEITEELARHLAGYLVILEGGIAQGKTSLARALDALLSKYCVPTVCFNEPTDKAALAEFMKYQEPPGDGATPEEKAKFASGRAAAAVRMQESMMSRRASIMREAAEFGRKGSVSIIDRGPFGDTTFMTSTYRKYDVPVEAENSYIIKFLANHLSIDYPKHPPFLIVHVRAPVEVTYPRYLERESGKPGNRYPMSYLADIEAAHDSCTRSWGRHLVYDNSAVPYVRPASPGSEADAEVPHGVPAEAAVKSVALALCKLAKELNEKKK